ncbi:MAG: dTDP-4-dehydrorhamnose 3,5-epimerase family protein [Acidimicrobiia bacterium]|nr:dTDP-4-dehydrorhamnose 3,5-epimerase family protein [Acidimicrobiia bacterium]
MGSREPVRDQQTVTKDGEQIAALPVGAVFRPTVTQVDDRGSLWELLDPRWGAHPDPIVYAYSVTWRPGKIKAWAIHRNHDDRYAVLFGELLVVMYDVRPESPTHGMVSELVLSEYRRGLLTIPVGVWHGTQNIGTTDAAVVNFPTEPYDHEHPDKYRLPVGTPEIPYTFPTSSGW